MRSDSLKRRSPTDQGRSEIGQIAVRAVKRDDAWAVAAGLGGLQHRAKLAILSVATGRRIVEEV